MLKTNNMLFWKYILIIFNFSADGNCNYYAFSHCYKFVESLMSLNDATALCNGNAESTGYIMEINSAEENELIHQILNGIFKFLK